MCWLSLLFSICFPVEYGGNKSSLVQAPKSYYGKTSKATTKKTGVTRLHTSQNYFIYPMWLTLSLIWASTALFNGILF